MQTLKSDAERGSATVQFELGKMYFEGDGVTKDEGMAANLLQQSMVNGNPLALKYFQKVAGEGNARFQAQLGWMFYEGKGVDKDYKQAFEWTRKAVDQEYDVAMVILGMLYFEGHGVETDHIEAYKWYAKAGEKGKKMTAEIEKVLTPEQIVIWRRRLGPDFLRSKG